MFFRIITPCLFVAVLFVTSCKKEQEVSVIKGDTPAATSENQSGPAVDCACGDMQCWRQATNDGVKDQVACAKDAMEKVIPIIGPILDIATNIAETKDGLAGLADVINIAEEIIKARNTSAGFPNELSCIADIAKAFEGAMSPLKQLDKASKLFTEGPSYDNAKALGDMLKAAYDGATKFSALIGRGNQNCVIDPTKAEHKKWQQKLTTLKTKPQAFFSSFISRSKDIVKSPIDKINVARTVFTCAGRIFKGARTLYKNTQCLLDDLKALEASKLAVARSLAYVGSRQYNHAKYIGCSQCVYSSYRDSTETEYKKCRSCCETRKRSDLDPYQREAWVASCQLTCGVARTEGLFWDYTDEQVCKEVRGMFHVSRMFRKIPMIPTDTPEKDQKQMVENVRARAVASINQFEQYFMHVAGQAKYTEFIEMQDLEMCRDQPGFHRELRDACGFFAEKRYLELFQLLESSEDNNPDGSIGKNDLSYFRDEISEYRHDSEYDRANVTETLQACGEWGTSASKSESWNCDFNRAYQRCREHASHRGQTIEKTKPLEPECVGTCLQAARAECK